MKPNIVYWGEYTDKDADSDSQIPLVNLSMKAPEKIIKKKNYPELTKSGNFFACPSFTSLLNSTFNILSPMDYDLEWDELGFSTTHLDQGFFDKNVMVRSSHHGIVSLRIANYIFFTELDSCIMTFNNAYYSNSNFTKNTDVIIGKVDIAKWFRPTDLSFIFKEKYGSFVINENDPLYSVNFDFGNNEPVILKKFMVTSNIISYVDSCIDLKNYGFDIHKYKSPDYFKQIYKIFNQSKIKKIILRDIKNNLME